jgi:hypothetical protein
MNEHNLIPLTTRPKGEHRLIAQKGGQTKSPLRGQAQKWRFIKERMRKEGASEDDIKWMIERMENRDAMAVDIIKFVEEIKKTVHPSQRVALANTQIAAAKFQHGEKIKTENVNVNINTDFDEWRKRMKDEE